MDPVTCLGIASAVVQFVDFGTKLVSEGKELYNSANGASKENAELEKITLDLSLMSQKLSLPTRPGNRFSKDEIELRKVAASCKDVADELLGILDGIRVNSPHKKWQSFRQALRSVIKKESIQSFRLRLDRLQQQVQFRLLNILNDRQCDVISSVKELEQESTRLATKTTDQLEALQTELADAISQVTQRQAFTTIALREASENILAVLSNIEKERNRIAKSLKLLDSLHFSSMSVRLSNVKERHAETFQWIFKRTRDAAYRQPVFLNWLESMGGIYWVAGKAGSGKSTLMKYLWQHQSTRNALQCWAGPQKLIMVNHFFWNAGNNPMQMSQVGLLRSLLYQVLRQVPELIVHVCTEDSEIDDYFHDWTLAELLKAFNRLANQSLIPVKICLFVDGLDEYNGDQTEICRLFKNTAASKTMKCCISSRPLNVFENAFGGHEERKLMLQDLTRHDIQIYVSDKLEEDHRFRALALKDRRWKDLIQQIVDKAEGVFLWVYLVVQSLLHGLEDDNDIPDMQERVDILPSDLEKYFKHMLSEIDEIYRSQTAQIFQMCLHAKSPLTAMTFTFTELERNDPDYAIKANPESPSQERLEATKEKMKKYINARSRGLLEINVDRDQSFSMEYKVDFLHRTVRDFLKTKEIQDMLLSQQAPGFEVNRSLCRATLAQIKTLQPSEISNAGTTTTLLKNMTKTLMSYAQELEMQHRRPESRILDELDRFHALYTKAAVPISRTVSEMQDWEEVIQDSLGATFLAWAIESELYLYVAKKLKAHPSLLRSLLDYALQFGLYGRYMDQDPIMLKLLLNGGVKDETLTDGDQATVWNGFMSACRQVAASLVAK